MNILTRGDIIKFEDKWLVIDCLDDSCLLMQLETSRTRIKVCAVSELLLMIENDEAELLCRDPAEDMDVSYNETGMTAELNDRMRKTAEDLLTQEESLFWLADREKRAAFFRRTAEKYEVSTFTVRRFVRDYLQNNLSLRIIGCKYFRCGGKGKMKTYNNGKRAGRMGISQVPRTDGVVVQFEAMLKRYLSSKTRMSISMLYEDLCRQYYSTKKIVNGEMYYELYPASCRPTQKQIYNFVKSRMTSAEKYTAQYGSKNTRNNIRPLHSDTIADLEIKSIGGRYEMDEMETDYYLVSRHDRSKPIGRAILYLMIDVYSKMITGFSVGLDNNSWDGAKMALLNMAEDKVEICKRAGIDINYDKWPVSGVLPCQIEVDNGAEYLGENFEKFSRENGIKVAYVPPGMGSYKPNVEQAFRQFNSSVNGRIPGEIIKGEYGMPHIMNARLTIEEFYKVVLQFIIYHNNTTTIKYRGDAAVFAAAIVPTPVNVWTLCQEKQNGLRKIQNMDQYKYSLLVEGKASITREGIVHHKVIYTCEDEKWLEAQMQDVCFNGRKSLNIRYDNRNMNIIYFELNGKIVQGWINERKTSNEIYAGCSLREVLEINRTLKEIEWRGNEQRLQEKINMNSKVDSIVKEARKKHTQSNSKRDIRENRLREKEALHREAQVAIGTENINGIKAIGIAERKQGKGRAPSLMKKEELEKDHKLSTLELTRLQRDINYEVNVLGYDPE